MIENMMRNKESISKIALGVILLIFSFLVVYRTIHPIKTTAIVENFTKEMFKSEEVVLDNEKIALTINLKGGMLEHFYFKEESHYLFEQDVENCFETLWISKNNKLSLPGRNTRWTVKSINNTNSKSVLNLCTEINGIKFVKTITVEEYVITIEDSFTNIPQSYLDMDEDLLSYGGFSCSKSPQDNMEFVGYLNNKQKVLRVPHRSLQKDSKQKISNHDGVLGVENNFFIALCEVDHKQGNIFIQNSTQNDKINQIFSLSTGTHYKLYKLYLLPKKTQLLAKYNFNNLIDYGKVLFPITYGLSLLLNWLLEHFSGIVALVLMALLLIFSNIFFIILIEKEKFKLKLHDREKKTIDDNYTGKELQQQLARFYKQHDIKMLRIMLLPIIMPISWLTLNYVIGFSFSLRKQGFLWLTDLSLPDGYSVFNLYGLLNFSPTIIPFSNYLASDVLCICSAIFMIIQTNNILQNNKNNETNNTAVPRNLLMVIHYVLFSSMWKRAPSGFVVCFLLISLGNILVTQCVKYYISSRKSLV